MNWTDIVPVLVSVIGSLIAAKYYGDVAGTRAAIEFEKRKAVQANIVALKALLNEIARIRSIAGRNSELVRHNKSFQTVVRIPVMAFEVAFLSKESSLLEEDENVSSEILDTVTAYLTEAHSINTLVEVYIRLTAGLSSQEARWRAEIVTKIVDKSKALLSILQRLESHLRNRLKSELEKQCDS